jgi:hypothetical protein
MRYGLDGNGRVLLPRQTFQTRLIALAPTSIPERKIKAIEPYIYSIDHKLNVARYSAGLVRAVRPDDYGGHYYAKASGGCYSSQTEYPGCCAYYANDWEQYVLSLLFFIDTFSAAAFSLFDSSGQLLREIYNLSLTPDKANFFLATNEMKTLSPYFYSKYFAQYRIDETSCKDWFKLLKELRNHMTHAEVTDIVRLDTPTPPHAHEIYLRKDSIGSPNDLVLKQFIEDCFNGLEEYVEQLYDKLAQQAENEKSLPLTGRFDHLI